MDLMLAIRLFKSKLGLFAKLLQISFSQPTNNKQNLLFEAFAGDNEAARQNQPNA